MRVLLDILFAFAFLYPSAYGVDMDGRWPLVFL